MDNPAGPPDAILLPLAQNRQHSLGDDKAVLVAYQALIDARERIGGAEEYVALEDIARLLTRQPRFAEPLRILKRAEPDTLHGTWRQRIFKSIQEAEQFREADRRARQSVELAAKVAKRHRVRLAIENHKDHRVAERLALLKHISSPWVGACVDLGNDVALLEDPMESVRAYAPWAMSVHLKDVAVAEYAEGFLLADVPLGRGILDLQQMVNVLRQAKPELRFVLEMITRDPLRVPCLTEKYWATLSEVPGERLARTLRLVRQHARQDLPKVTALSADEQLALEHRNVVESLAFARENLGLR